ncbi:unnamed protein product, partial [marine sediment metagenome]
VASLTIIVKIIAIMMVRPTTAIAANMAESSRVFSKSLGV